MLFDDHKTHDMVRIKSGLDASNKMGGAWLVVVLIVFPVTSQNERSSRLMLELAVKANTYLVPVVELPLLSIVSFDMYHPLPPTSVMLKPEVTKK